MNPDAIDWAAFEAKLRQKYTPKQVTAELLEPLTEVIPKTARMVGSELKPKLNKYIPISLHDRQNEFLMLDCLDAFYGGAAGGGKSFALLAVASQFLDIPGYRALIMRRSFSELSLPGALMDIARQWWSGKPGIRQKDGGKEYEFETGGSPSSVTFGYLENINDRIRYDSAQFHSINVDEVTHFPESDFTYMFSRLRNPPPGIPLRMRCTGMPSGPGRLWVKKRYVDDATREPGTVFVKARVDDNIFMRERDLYKTNLATKLGPIESAQLLKGDWEIQASGVFMRHWFKIVSVVPAEGRYIRYWDLAATEPAPGKDPSWTASVKIGANNGQYVIADAIQVRLTPKAIEDLVVQTAYLDGSRVVIRMEQEPGSSGVAVIDHYTRLLAGYDFRGDKVTGRDYKQLRANALASQAERGNVLMVAGQWNKSLLDEISVFPGGGHDDQVTAMVGGFSELTGVMPVDVSAIRLVGRERLTADW